MIGVVSLTYESGHLSNGTRRQVEIIKRTDGTVYARIAGDHEHCYLELDEIRQLAKTAEEFQA